MKKVSLASLAIGLVLAILPGCATTGTANRSEPAISGVWSVQQSNGYTGAFTITQQGNKLGGTAVWQSHQSGTITGMIRDSLVALWIDYHTLVENKNLVGTYTAILSGGGQLMTEGQTVSSLGDHAFWNARREQGKR